MKILVFSDSHRRIDRAVDFIQNRGGGCDLVIHLGDLASDAETIRGLSPELPMITMPGNCDYGLAGQPQEMFCELDGVPAMLLHGHTRAVKSGLLTLECTALCRGVRLVLFGHTHEAYTAYREGIYYLNPGAASGWSASAGMVEIRNGQILTNIFNL